MTLDIIIPCYNEAEKTIVQLLSSINNQIGVDFNDIKVTLVNDAGNLNLSNTFFYQFENLNTSFVKLEKNIGNGMARQYGIDHTNNEFIMFIDADDCLYHNLVLHTIVKTIQSDNSKELYMWKMLSERKTKDGTDYTILDPAATWLHGKVYRRSALEKRNIRFSPELRVQIDTYFNGLFMVDNPNVLRLNEPIYIWRFNENSITRRAPDFIVTSLENHFKGMCLLQDRFELENRPSKAIKFYDALLNVYYTLQLPAAKKPEYAEIIASCEKMAAELFKKYYSNAKLISVQQFSEVDTAQYLSHKKHGLITVKETFNQFIKRITETN